MEVQQYLRNGGQLEKLAADLHLELTFSKHESLVILNYTSFGSPKMDPIVRECRGLTLNTKDWSVVARSFQRFFNYGENPLDSQAFDWHNFVAREKCDGSLASLYWWNGGWRVNTRGSFALGEIEPGVGKTWEEVFWSTSIDEIGVDTLSHQFTYVFELCSPFNKIVRHYASPTLYLLAAFHNESGQELSDVACDGIAVVMNVPRPAVIVRSSVCFSKPELIIDLLSKFYHKNGDKTFEGVVLCDANNVRIKYKNGDYVTLHHLRGEDNNRHLPQYLIRFVFDGESDEIEAYYPEVVNELRCVKFKVYAAMKECADLWERAKHIEQKKDFALFIADKTRMHWVLYELFKTRGAETVEQIFRRLRHEVCWSLFNVRVPMKIREVA